MKKTLSIAVALFCTFYAQADQAGGDGLPKIVTFGDSTTAVRGGAENYTSQLEKRFPGIRFVNRGIGGNTTEMGRKRFVAQVLEENAKLVVVQFGINDAAVDVWKTPPATESRVSLARYEENLRYFIGEIRKAGGKVILMSPNQMRWGPAKIIEMYGKPPYKPEDEMGFTLILSDYAAVARKVAKEEDVPLVDVYAIYDEWERTHGESCKKLMSDGMHPNTLGHQVVADALEPLIRKTLDLN